VVDGTSTNNQLPTALAVNNSFGNFVRRDGTTPLTGNWTVGAFDITSTGALNSTTLATTGNATVGGNLIGNGTNTFNGATSITGANTFTVGTGATTLGGTLGVTGLTTLSNTNGLQFGAGQMANEIVTVVDGTSTNNQLPTALAVNNSFGNFVRRDGTTPLTGNWTVGAFDITSTGALNSTTLATTGNGTIGGNLGVTGITTLTGNLIGNGTNTFNGATSVTGANTFSVGTGQATFNGNLDANNGLDVTGANLTVNGGNLSVGAGAFTVNGTSGNVSVAAGNFQVNGSSGNLSMGTGNLVINGGTGTINVGAGNLQITGGSGNISAGSGNFSVLGVSGNLSIGGASGFNVTGATGALNIGSGLFTVAPATGNTLIGGTITASNLNAGGIVRAAAGTGLLSVGTLGSADITDGSIVDADVNASAAIAGSKINPNFGTQNISTSGTLSAGATTLSGALAMGNNIISNLATPVAANDAATKQYVDDATLGLSGASGILVRNAGTISGVTASANAIFRGNGTTLIASNITDNGTTVTVGSALTQTGAGNQVTFEGNVNANNGLDVTNNSLTVGGTNFTVAPATGNTSVNGTMTIQGFTNIVDALALSGMGSNLEMEGNLTMVELHGPTTATLSATNVKTLQIGTTPGTPIDNIRTDVRPTATADDISLVTEKAVRDAIDASTITADNGITITTGNAHLGGNLTQATAINTSGFDLTITGNETLFLAGNTNLNVAGASTLQGSLDVLGNTTLGGNLTITGLTSVSDLQTNAGGTLFNASDARYKKDIQPIANALEKAKQIEGVSYLWKEEFSDNKTLQLGVIAQELEKVFPNLVQTNEKGYKSVNYIGLIPVMLEAIKEQQKQIDALTNKVSSLNTENSSLKTQVSETATLKAQMETMQKQLNVLMLLMQNQQNTTAPTTEKVGDK
jgi:hypothetical protein